MQPVISDIDTCPCRISPRFRFIPAETLIIDAVVFPVRADKQIGILHISAIGQSPRPVFAVVRDRINHLSLMRRKIIPVVIDILHKTDSELLLLARTVDQLRLLHGAVQRRQQHCRQNSNDRNHDQELYQSKNFYFLPAKQEHLNI